MIQRTILDSAYVTSSQAVSDMVQYTVAAKYEVVYWPLFGIVTFHLDTLIRY